MASFLVLLAVFAPLVGSVAVLLVQPEGLGAGRFVTAACGVGAIAALAVAVLSGQRDDGLVGDVVGWGLRVDRSSALLLSVVMGTGVVVSSFARRNVDLDPLRRRFFALLGLLVSGSALVVVPGNAIALLFGWIVSSWTLVAAVGHRNELPATKQAQRRTAQALMVGDVALLLAVVIALVASEAGVTSDVALVVGDLQSSSLLGIGASDLVAILIVIAGASRSALLPFHRWLIATLAAPTPVSALVHAGFVSGAGLLLVRFGSLVSTSFVAVHLAFALAVATVVIAVGAGSTRVDVKGKLAWSTVAQMGFMVLQCTVGAFSSAVFHIAGHGMYKASMFLGASDAISASLRTSRRAAPLALPSVWVRTTAATAIATGTVAVGVLVIPPDVSDGGVILVVVFAWLTVAQGVWGWLERGVSTSSRSIAQSALGGFLAVVAYLGGLRVVEHFVKPSFGDVADESGVRPVTLLATLAAVAILGAVWRFARTPSIDPLRAAVHAWLLRTAHPSVAGGLPIRPSRAGRHRAGPSPDGGVIPDRSAEMRRSQIRADAARAANIIAPAWPLTSVVAVNPLGGLESLGFDAASALARSQFGARTHLSLEDFRHDHRAGLTTGDDLRWSIESTFAEACAEPPILIDGRSVTVAEIIEADMLHGPDVPELVPARTALERAEGVDGVTGAAIDATIFHSAVHHVARSTSPVNAAGAGAVSFTERWRRVATSVSSLRLQLSPASIEWLSGLGTDPAAIVDASLAVTRVDDDARIDEMRRHLARLQGWAGYAKWRTDWAHRTESRPTLTPIELVAARCALEAAVLMSVSTESGASSTHSARTCGIDARAGAVVDALGLAHAGPDEIDAVRQIVGLVAPERRQAAWLRAQERSVDLGLLSALDRLDPGAPLRDPDAQLVFCIDVRSEGLRHHIEAAGPYDTLGFAGFFGAAMSVQRIEWDHAEARCPVLVSPSMLAVERPVAQPAATSGVDRMLAHDRRTAAVGAAHSRTKSGAGASFAMAEAAGWFVGPHAAVRTLLPRSERAVLRPATRIGLEHHDDPAMDAEQRTFLAEAILRTMGLTTDFAPLVMLCGHASRNVNNPHATALDCGACAGASGEDNARTIADLLNEQAVRDGLFERGIEIPAGTHFLPALHETVSDHVEILDRHAVPSTHTRLVERLVDDLEIAGAQQSAVRAQHLPGPASQVRRRGADWAQVRPEWGLARNAAFVIGPRSMTSGLDLDGRAFLHTYDADSDPDGKVLETIMTAPLVVAHWISSQYYFSTVDPEVFGAGDKLIHNIAAGTGVISGDGGDLRVGLPLQSTHVGNERHHRPVRLLAVIQAPLERIERIIRENPVLATLTEGSWIRVAGRSHPHERWSMRTADGTWSSEPRPIPTDPILETT